MWIDDNSSIHNRSFLGYASLALPRLVLFAFLKMLTLQRSERSDGERKTSSIGFPVRFHPTEAPAPRTLCLSEKGDGG